MQPTRKAHSTAVRPVPSAAKVTSRDRAATAGGASALGQSRPAGPSSSRGIDVVFSGCDSHWCATAVRLLNDLGLSTVPVDETGSHDQQLAQADYLVSFKADRIWTAHEL